MKHGILKALALATLLASPAWAGDKPSTKPAAADTKAASGDHAAAESRMDVLRQKLKTDKRYIVSENLALTDKEAKGFWPLYDSYQKDLEKLNHRIGAAVATYADAYDKGPIPDDLSKKLIKETLDIEKAELEAKQAHLSRVEKVLPPNKLARYAQIENKIRALIKYELAVEIPLAE
jgi:hypothetical protein